ncbi:MAG: NAD(P)/FAD-dependent oxidoreductase [Bacteriovoracaceae bacterium]|nr:NAD(P)/FAD-dependent oxidoreductase [Bacteriovoracaceae bacterium]
MIFGIIGHGAAGTFAALRLREKLGELGRKPTEDRILLFEKAGVGLRKVKISGGGRCNVTHHQYDQKLFCKNYPRGSKELLGPFHQFQAKNTVDWFQKRGIKLKVETDGRMFPETNTSQTIIDCFLSEIQKGHIEILNHKNIVKCEHSLETFKVTLGKGETYDLDGLVLATGSDRSGYLIAQGLGHSITELAPSLFTFKINHPLLKALPGTSFEKVKIEIPTGKKKWQEEGPMIITHWGLSGPAVLKLSAWAARELKSLNYKFPLFINFLGLPREDIERVLLDHIKQNSKKLITTLPLKGLTKNFWQVFIDIISKSYPKLNQKIMSEVSKKEISTIIDQLYRFEFNTAGHHRFKEEFVECGGVATKEINFKTMESKICKGLFFAGEILDVDGITGGFNFQNAWTTGHIAGESLANLTNINTGK